MKACIEATQTMAAEHTHSGKELAHEGKLIASELNHHDLAKAEHRLRSDYLHMNHHAFNNVVHAMQHHTHGLGVEHDRQGNVLALNFEHHHIFSAAHSNQERRPQQNERAHAPTESQPHKHATHSQSESLPQNHTRHSQPESLPQNHTRHSQPESLPQNSGTERPHHRNPERSVPQRDGGTPNKAREKQEQPQKSADPAEQELEKGTWANLNAFGIQPATAGHTEIKDGAKVTTWGTGEQTITHTLLPDGTGSIVGHNWEIKFFPQRGQYSMIKTSEDDDAKTTITRDRSGMQTTDIEAKKDPDKSTTVTIIPGKDGSKKVEWGKKATNPQSGYTRENGYTQMGDGTGNCRVHYLAGTVLDGVPNPKDENVSLDQIKNDYQVTCDVKDGLRHFSKNGKDVYVSADSDAFLPDALHKLKGLKAQEQQQQTTKTS
jgi:hypothetical protein